MRREQIHKICLNHLLSSDVEYMPKDAKSWQFIANDFSEGTFELDNFCLRFKTEDIAKDFKKAIDDIRANELNSNVNGMSSTAAAPSISTTSNATAEELKHIINLQMDGNFYDYKVRDDCPGCRGCSDDDFEIREVKDTNFGQYDDNPLPLIPPPAVYLAQHNDLSINTKKSMQPNPFSLNSSSSNGNFSFGAAIAAATASGNTTANSTQQSGMFFGNNSFKFVTSTGNGSVDGGNKDANNSGQANLFGGNITSSSSSAETIKPSFSFNSSTVFGGTKCMCACYRFLRTFF